MSIMHRSAIANSMCYPRSRKQHPSTYVLYGSYDAKHHSGTSSFTVLSIEGQRIDALVRASGDGTLRRWEVLDETTGCMKSESHANWINDAVLSGQALIACSSDADATIEIDPKGVHYCGINAHPDDEFVRELLEAKSMNEHDCFISRDIIYGLLQRCLSKKSLASSRFVHSLMIRCGLDFVAPLGDHLIRAFTLCERLSEANRVFLKIPIPSVFTWNAIISAHVNLGESNAALELFVKMGGDVMPDKVTFLFLLKACSISQALQSGRAIHYEIILSGLEVDPGIGNTIIDMYAKCGSLEEARCVFELLPNRDSITWSVMIAGYVGSGCYQSALEVFEKMQHKDVSPSRVVLSCTLKACGNIRALGIGLLIHDKIEKLDIAVDAFIGSALVNMYALFGLMDEAQKVFDKAQNKNVQMWGEMIGGYMEHDLYDKAMYYFEKMQIGGLQLDKPSCLRILKACGSKGVGRQCMIIHDIIIRAGLDGNTMVGNTLVDVYAKCGCLIDAHKVFENVKNRDVVSWSVMISGYAHYGDGHPALCLFNNMRKEGITPSKVSFLGVLKACASAGELDQGRMIHDQIAHTRLMFDVLIGSTLIDMYAKCGSLEEAREVFDCLPNRNIVVWGAMIAGYAQHGLGGPALELYKKMQQENILPDKVLFASVLQACASIRELDQGRLIHDEAVRDGCESHLIVGNTLIDLYAKCGSMEEARRVFDNLPSHDAVSWATMITGYAQHEHGLAALQLFEITHKEGIEVVNRVVFLGLLKACGSLGALEQGLLIHNRIIEGGLELDVVVCNTLLDMYAKSGSLDDAQAVFDGIKNKDEVSWSSMIAGYAWCSEWDQVKKSLQIMQQDGMTPDDVTFTNVLTACSHAGRLPEGCWFFTCMQEDHDITPSLEHYSCLVDLLSRMGCLEDAEDLLQSIPIHPDLVVWMSLLTSCKLYGNKDLGKRCFGYSHKLDPRDASGYVLMSDMYVDPHMWIDVQRILHLKRRAEMQRKGLKAKSCEIWGEDGEYPQFDQIKALLGQLGKTMESSDELYSRIGTGCVNDKFDGGEDSIESTAYM